MASLPLAAADGGKQIPIGLELYSVRDDLHNDLFGTVRKVAGIGFQCVEFYAPYYDWTPETAGKVRQLLDDTGMRCYSTHNDLKAISPDGIGKAIELNRTLGAKYIVLAHPGSVKGSDGWKRVIDTLNAANERMAPEGIHAGYHNHDLEWKPVDGKKPIEMIAEGTDHSIMLQLDVGTCVETGNDPVAWINRNPGRIKSLHLKDWSKDEGYRVLFGEGVAPWKEIFAAAQSRGGAEYYLLEQEGSRYPEMQAAEMCLANYRKLTAA